MKLKLLCLLLITFSSVPLLAQNWTLIDTSITHTDAPLTGAFFTDDTTGYVVGGSPSTGSGGVILKTTDAGVTWTLKHVSYWMNYIYFPSRDTGYAVGMHATIMKTTDAGATWTYQNSGISTLYWAVSVCFLTNDIGFVGVRNGPGYAFLKTSNGGTSWINDVSDTVHMNTCAKINDSTIYAIFGMFSKTTDRGNSWENLPIPLYGDALSMTFVDDSIGFATMQKSGGSPCFNYSSLIKTTDAGQTWQETNYDCGYVGAIDFPSRYTGYMIGSPNVIYKTQDGGDTWNYLPLPYDSAAQALGVGCYFMTCTDTNTCYLLNNNGTIFKTINGGGAVGITEKEKVEDDKLFVYPNPTSDRITIEFNLTETKNAKIELKNLVGQTIKKIDTGFAAGNNQIEMDMAEFPKGLYFVQMQNGNKIFSKKIIKQ